PSTSPTPPKNLPVTPAPPPYPPPPQFFPLFLSPCDPPRKPPSHKTILCLALHSPLPHSLFSLRCEYTSPLARSLRPSFPRQFLHWSRRASPFLQFRRVCCGKSLRQNCRAFSGALNRGLVPLRAHRGHGKTHS